MDENQKIDVDDEMFKGFAKRAAVAEKIKDGGSGKPTIEIIAKDIVNRRPDPELDIKHKATKNIVA